ncbi:hypothetical protein DB346_13435 [Verrucomicrobia bacterium LW23]|nr:hypothetical protein DB346_13435 [Verrucomicrobia bacterium LW23]
MCREVIPLLKENALEPAPEAAAGDVLDVLGAVGAVPSTTPTTAAAAEAVPPSGTAPATSLPPPPPSRGKIISLSGGGATAPMPRCSAYAASKAAVVRITETMAEELREFAIDVNAVAPGAMRTRMMQEVVDAGPEKAGEAYHAKNVHWMEEGGTTDPSVGAALCAWLASTESNGITGKLLSAQWDPWQNLAAFRQDLRGDIYTLRRIVPEDRGKKFE